MLARWILVSRRDRWCRFKKKKTFIYAILRCVISVVLLIQHKLCIYLNIRSVKTQQTVCELVSQCDIHQICSCFVHIDVYHTAIPTHILFVVFRRNVYLSIYTISVVLFTLIFGMKLVLSTWVFLSFHKRYDGIKCANFNPSNSIKSKPTRCNK
jgi:hypothetical protein